MLQRVGHSMNHDRPPRRPAVLARPHFILLVRVGHLDRQKVVAAGVAARQIIVALGRAKVVLSLLLADGREPSAIL